MRTMLAIAILVGLGCSPQTMSVQRTSTPRPAARWVMLPFSNYSETPQAGERVEAMLDTLLRKQGIAQLDRYPPLKEDDAHLIVSERQRYEESLAWAQQQHFDYGVAGSVGEWRYKSGVEGDPAVGVTVRIVELSTNKVVWSATGTRDDGATVSGAALRLLDSMVQSLLAP
jgi:hypothetical protein